MLKNKKVTYPKLFLIFVYLTSLTTNVFISQLYSLRF